MKRLRVLVADDHPVVRAGVAGMLSAEPDLEVVGLAKDGREAIELSLSLQPDVIVMDLRMPGVSGREAIRRLSAEGLGRRVLVLTTYDANTDVEPALAAGAAGYLLKDAGAADLVAAVRAVARGERAVSSALAERLARRASTPEVALSPRELEVLELLARGWKNRAIAKALFISEATVKTHLIHMFEKLGVADRTAAVTTAFKLGLVRIDG